MSRILGIDPGYGRLGYGIIEGERDQWKTVFFGCVETNAKDSLAKRLLHISEEMEQIIQEYAPTHAAVEELFFQKNVKTAIQVGQARGVVLLALQKADLPIYEYTPLQVKQAITGYGKAEKRQIQTLVPVLLQMKEKKIQDDAADALAVALTCGTSLSLQKYAQ